MKGGERWKKQILDALDQVRFLLTVLTKGALISEWASWEWKSASSRRVHIVPVLPMDPALKPEIRQFPGTIREDELWEDPSDLERLILHIQSHPHPPPGAPFLVPCKPST